MTLQKIEPNKERAEEVCKSLAIDASSIIQQGDDLAGYTIVAWDMRGDAQTYFSIKHGPVGGAMAPTFVKDCLNNTMLAYGVLNGVKKLYSE